MLLAQFLLYRCPLSHYHQMNPTMQLSWRLLLWTGAAVLVCLETLRHNHAATAPRGQNAELLTLQNHTNHDMLCISKARCANAAGGQFEVAVSVLGLSDTQRTK